MQKPDKLKVIVSGGGTGGHIFPAVAIANAIKEQVPQAEFLFIGAKGRMEMEKVPAAGYPIRGLWISGLQRSLSLSNLLFPLKVIVSFIMAIKNIKQFKPDLAIGTGGYASWPALRAAAWLGVPTLIQEQNSFPGIANKRLAGSAKLICVAYNSMERYFPSAKLRLAGNPVRSNIAQLKTTREEGCKFFGLDVTPTTLLVIGGSLGARTINQSIEAGLELITTGGLQLIWQTGVQYQARASEAVKPFAGRGIVTMPFISRMDAAFAAADIIVSRAGAIAISELCIIGKPVILVPSPNVAEDHQTKNALALSERNAALYIPDAEAGKRLISTLLSLAEDNTLRKILSENIQAMAMPKAADDIARMALELLPKMKD